MECYIWGIGTDAVTMRLATTVAAGWSLLLIISLSRRGWQCARENSARLLMALKVAVRARRAATPSTQRRPDLSALGDTRRRRDHSNTGRTSARSRCPSVRALAALARAVASPPPAPRGPPRPPGRRTAAAPVRQ